MGIKERQKVLMKISFQTEKQKNPSKNDGFKVIYAPAKRLAFKIRWYLLLSLILSPLVFFAWHMVNDQVLVTADGILTSEPIILVAAEEGFVSSVNVIPGQKVIADKNLVQLHSPVVAKEYELLSSKYQQFYQHHEQGLDSIEILHKRQIATLRKAEISQQLINDEYEEYNERGMLPLNDRLLIEQNNIAAKSRYQQALINYETAVIEHKNGALAKTLLDIELAMSSAQAKQGMLSLNAPKRAVVNDVFVKSGEFVKQGQPLVAISNLPKPVVNVYLAPDRMDYAKMGQTATITLPNGTQYQGVVNTPTQLSEKLPDVLSGPFEGSKAAIKVTLDITPTPEVMLEGLPVQVRFHYELDSTL